MTIYCFLEFSTGFAAIPGKVIIELFDTQVPKVCENFRALCTGEKGTLKYQGTTLHRVIETFTLQGGDTDGTGLGGSSIYGEDAQAFVGEDLFWRDVDQEMLVCTAENPPRSQFFVTLRPSPHLNGLHCCFGKIIKGQQILKQLSEVEVDDDDKPLIPITIARAGELEYKGPPIKSVLPSVQEAVTITEAAKRPKAPQSPRHSRPRSRSQERDRRARHEANRNERHRRSRSRSLPRRSLHDRTDERYHYRSPEPRQSSRRQSPGNDRITSMQRSVQNSERSERSTQEPPDVIYKGRGRMMYQARSKHGESYGRLT